MRRWLVALLSLGLVPVLVVTSPSVAEAAAEYGQVGTATVKWSGSEAYFGLKTPASSAECGVTAYYVANGPSVTVKTKTKCAGDWNSGIRNDGTMGAAFRGVDQSGAACAYSGSYTSDNGMGAGSAGLSGPVAPGTVCRATEVCLTFTYRQNWQSDTEYLESCSGITLGELPGGPPDVCPKGQPMKPKISDKPTFRSTPSGAYWYWAYDVDEELAAGSQLPWRFYYILETSDPNAVLGETMGREIKVQWVNTEKNTTAMQRHPLPVSRWVDWEWQKPPESENVKVLGAGAFFTGLGTGFDNTRSFRLPSYDPEKGRLGTTDTAVCSYYWGERIAEVPNSEIDMPLGGFGSSGAVEPDAVVPEPAAVTGSCDFDIASPSTWATGSLCALVELMRALLGVLSGLASAIVGPIVAAVNAVLDGLADLFVPDGDVIENQMDRLRDSWEDMALARWMEAFTAQTFAFPASASCEGIPLEVTLPGGVAVNERLLAACSGPMASAASLVRLILSAGLVIFGGLACLRAVGSGFGWSPGIGRGEG